MNKLVVSTKTLNQDALLDILSSYGKGNVSQGVLLALTYFFSEEVMSKNPEYIYDTVLEKEVYRRMKNGDDLVSIAMEFSDAKRVKKTKTIEEEARASVEEKTEIKDLQEGDKKADIFD